MMALATVADALEARGARVTRDASIAELVTYRVGGPVAALVRIGTDAELAAVAAVVTEHRPRVLVVGRGSNLLVADAGFAGLGVVLDGTFEDVEIGERTVTAGGAVALPVLARRSAAAGRADLEFLVGIPGSVGGAVRMNAGGHGREIREVLVRAWVADLTAADLTSGGVPIASPRDSFDFGYRHSDLGDSDLVVRAEFAVRADDPARCEARVADVVRWRRENQPGGANAGSVFRNPAGDSAGRLIDSCGLKGLRSGGASVSEKHANFIQAEPGARAADVRDLVVSVQRRVEAETGVHLVPELRLVGFGDA